MKPVHFPRWPEVLGQAALSEPRKQSYAITLRWYLAFCRRDRAEVWAGRLRVES